MSIYFDNTRKAKVIVIFVDLVSFSKFVAENETSSLNILSEFYQYIYSLIPKDKDIYIERFAGDEIMIYVDCDKYEYFADFVVNFLTRIFNDWQVVLSYRIGITVGDAYLSCLNTEKYSDIRCIGKVPNKAAFCCSLAKEKEIIIDENTKNILKNIAYESKLVEIKGSNNKEVLYKVLL